MSSLINRQEKIKPNLKNKNKTKIKKQKKIKTNSKIKNKKKMNNHSQMFQVIVGNNNTRAKQMFLRNTNPEKEENSKVNEKIIIGENSKVNEKIIIGENSKVNEKIITGKNAKVNKKLVTGENSKVKKIVTGRNSKVNEKIITGKNSKVNKKIVTGENSKVNEKIYIFGELALLNQNQINSLFKIFYSCFMNLDITNETYFGFLSKRNKTIGGFCYLNTETKSFGDKVGINTFPNSLFIYNFCINPKYRRKGYAIKLMKKFEKYTKNILKKDYIYLFVESKNKAAIKLYCKCKYIVDLMSDNIIVMKKKL